MGRRPVGIVLHDLPVLLGHQILAHEQRLAIQHADAPVIIGRHEFLRQDQVGFFQQFAADLLQFGTVAGLVDAATEGSVGDLQHHRVGQLALQLLQALHGVDHHRLRRRHLVGLQQLRQIDLVGAAQDRGRIVDRRHAFQLRLLGEAVGVVLDGRGLADEQRIIFGEAQIVLLLDQLDIHAHALGDADQFLQRGGVGGRQFLLRVVQHRHGVFRRRAGLRLTPAGAGVLVQRPVEQGVLVRVEIVDAERADAGNLQPLAMPHRDFQ